MLISDLWANRIISGDRSYDDVPAKLKDSVAKLLKDRGHPELITDKCCTDPD